jgi:hypothetical protein
LKFGRVQKKLHIRSYKLDSIYREKHQTIKFLVKSAERLDALEIIDLVPWGTRGSRFSYVSHKSYHLAINATFSIIPDSMIQSATNDVGQA